MLYFFGFFVCPALISLCCFAGLLWDRAKSCRPASLRMRAHAFNTAQTIVVEHDRDHDYRADRDRCRADHRPLFEDGDDDPVRFFVLCAKRQPATPIRNLRLAPSKSFVSNNAKRSYFGKLLLSLNYA